MIGEDDDYYVPRRQRIVEPIVLEEPLTVSRKVIGWEDAITHEAIKTGDEIIRIAKNDKFIFKRKPLEDYWTASNTRKNPLTRSETNQSDLEYGIAQVVEDDGDEPMGGRRRRTRRFRFPRRMTKKYCKKTPCKRMGFTQKASCRPYKNCYQ